MPGARERTCPRSPAGLVAAATVALLFVRGSPAADLGNLVREQKVVVVDGRKETWMLEWQAAPLPMCGAEDVATALSCTCSGFAYGEAGGLILVRLRPGMTREVLDLTPFFKGEATPGGGSTAVVQRWRPVPATAHDEDDDWHHASDFNFIKRVQARGTVEVMRIGDYNHDGRASEFLLQVGTQPCGRQVMVLVGISRLNPQLHLFASADAPTVPLAMGPRVWEAVRKSDKPVRVVEWPCGDQAGEVESTVTVAVRRGIFNVQRDNHSCQADGQ